MRRTTDHKPTCTSIALRVVGAMREHAPKSCASLHRSSSPSAARGFALYADPTRYEADQALNRLYALVRDGEPRAAMDELLATVDRALHDARFALIDAMLSQANLDRLNLTLELALLGFTQCEKDKLPYRERLVSVVEGRLRRTDPERAQRLLSRVR